MKENKKKKHWFKNLGAALHMELREHKSSFMVYFILRILVIVMMVLQLLNRNYENVFLCALTLLLAGHTHGGQVRLPLNIEFTLLKKDILPKKGIYYGFHTYNGTPLYITSGIGCSLLPIRFRSKAEIALIE